MNNHPAETELKEGFRSLPLQLGSPLRVAHFAWAHWGIKWANQSEFKRFVKQSEEEYAKEWTRTTGASHQDIALASKAAGLHDANQRLNRKVAEIVRVLINRVEGGKVQVLDLGAGAGATTLAILDAIGQRDRDRVHWVLLDPAEKALGQAYKALIKAGVPGNRVEVVVGSDLICLPKWPRRFDVVVSAAAIHHHAYLQPLFSFIAKSLKPGGHLVVGDWFNGLSLDPSKVLWLLWGLDWPEKEVDLGVFERLIGGREANWLKVRPEDRRADEQIAAFWRNYAQIRHPGASSFIVLEGHRRPRHYVADLRRAGMMVPSRLPGRLGRNPTFLTPDSSLLGVLWATKR
jgi:SAM-dependent methyltransferase